MTEQLNILNDIRTLEAHFASGLKEATRLRKKLEGDSSSSGSRKGLSPDQKAKIRAGRKKSLLKR